MDHAKVLGLFGVCPWQVMELSDAKYWVKGRFSGTSYDLLVSDLEHVWIEELVDIQGHYNRFNKSFSANDQGVVKRLGDKLAQGSPSHLRAEHRNDGSLWIHLKVRGAVRAFVFVSGSFAHI